MELVNAMLQGRLDAAFVRTPVGPIDGLVVDHVLEEPMVAALPAGHALVQSNTAPLPLAALATEPFILYRRPAGPGLYDAIVTACRGAGFSPVIEQEAPRLPSTLSLVAAGLGIAIVPASMEQASMPGVAFRALQECPGLSAPINLALRRPPSTDSRTVQGDRAPASDPTTCITLVCGSRALSQQAALRRSFCEAVSKGERDWYAR